MANSLYHHGIQGMKWGKRNGPPYPLKPSAKSAAERRASGKRPKKSEAQKQSEQAKRRDMVNRGTLTEEELRQKIQRLRLEKELRELTENEIDPGRRYVNDILKAVGSGIAIPALKGTGLYALKAIFSREFSGKELGSAIFNGGPKKK